MVLVVLFIEGTACYKKVSTATVPMDSDLRTLFGYILLLISSYHPLPKYIIFLLQIVLLRLRPAAICPTVAQLLDCDTSTPLKFIFLLLRLSSMQVHMDTVDVAMYN